MSDFGDEAFDFDAAGESSAALAKPEEATKARPASPFRGGFRHVRFFMDRPCFALSPKRQEPMTVETKAFWFSVTAGAAGHALVADADILIYAASALTEQMNAGQELTMKLSFRPVDLLRAVHRSTDGKRSYKLLEQALLRLEGTEVSIDQGSAQPQPSGVLPFDRAIRTSDEGAVVDLAPALVPRTSQGEKDPVDRPRIL
jgi:hypothetical protein